MKEVQGVRTDLAIDALSAGKFYSEMYPPNIIDDGLIPETLAKRFSTDDERLEELEAIAPGLINLIHDGIGVDGDEEASEREREKIFPQIFSSNFIILMRADFTYEGSDVNTPLAAMWVSILDKDNNPLTSKDQVTNETSIVIRGVLSCSHQDAAQQERLSILNTTMYHKVALLMMLWDINLSGNAKGHEIATKLREAITNVEGFFEQYSSESSTAHHTSH